MGSFYSRHVAINVCRRGAVPKRHKPATRPATPGEYVARAFCDSYLAFGSDNIWFGAMAVTKPNEFIGFGAMAVTKPYEFIGFGAH